MASPASRGKLVLQSRPNRGIWIVHHDTNVFLAAAALATIFLSVPCWRHPCAGGMSAAETSRMLTANDILHAVREGQASRHEALDGQLRNDEDGKVFPFRLVADGPQVRYQFGGTPPTTVQVRYNEENSELQESGSGAATEKLNPANFDKKHSRDRPGVRGLGPALHLLVEGDDEGRGYDQAAQGLETAARRPEPPDAVFQRQSLGGQGKRRAAAGRGLRLAGQADQALRGGQRPEVRTANGTSSRCGSKASTRAPTTRIRALISKSKGWRNDYSSTARRPS